ncbi:MAG: PIG-L family deacetylase [bacterium]
MKKIKQILRSALNLKRIYTNQVVVSSLQNNVATEFYKDVPSGKVLVLAPHPDDEIIGCGGALLKHAKGDDKIKIVYFTDGRLGFPDKFKPTEKDKVELAAEREQEAKNLSEELKCEQVFLRYEDSKLTLSKNLFGFLRQLISEFESDIIYTPSILEPILDHNITSAVLANALQKIEKNFQIFQYELWSPIFANFYLDIDDVIDQKQKLIEYYKSQLKCRDYVESSRGLARYRGSIFGKSKFAESYLKTDKKLFLKLFELADEI